MAGETIYIPTCPLCGATPTIWAGMIKASKDPGTEESPAPYYCLQHDEQMEPGQTRPQLVWRAYERSER